MGKKYFFLRLIPPWMRLAVEFRHPSWHHDDVLALLEAHGAAYCVQSGANLPCLLRVTADFAYVRLHGPDHQHLYAGSYSQADLGWWADRCREHTPDGYTSAVALLKAVYDIVDRVKAWEEARGLDGAEEFRRVQRALREASPLMEVASPRSR